MSYKSGPQAAATEATGQLMYDYYSKGGTGFYGFDVSGKGDNSGDPTLDAMLEKARGEFDTEKRRAQVFEIQRYLAKPMYAIRYPGGANGFNLIWPVVKNYNVWRGDPRAAYMKYWLDESQPPVGKKA